MNHGRTEAGTKLVFSNFLPILYFFLVKADNKLAVVKASSGVQIRQLPLLFSQSLSRGSVSNGDIRWHVK